MTPERWERIKDLFNAAVELPPDERARLLAESCDVDEPARGEVARLLGESDRAGDFMETPPLPALNASPPDEDRTFAGWEIVAQRFRIIRFIGRGGMGEVYEAEDLELHERVALKTVRPAIAADEKSLEALKREIHNARKVTHPNVNRIFDLERNRQPGGGEVACLTMELLEGETLAERLQRVGRMTPSEAWPLVEQMAAGLTAAHAAGIVHRDFKPGNVMLVDTPNRRAVITDFGLSRAVDGAADTRAASGAPSTALASGALGTPSYMAPEQLEGGSVTAAADIYAFGVVLYEMLSGTLPFGGQSPASVAMKRLTVAPVAPRAHVPELDAKWQKAILRCLERDPAARFASAADVAAALGGKLVGRPDPARPRVGLLAGTLLAAALLALLLGALWWLFPRNRQLALPLSSPVKLTGDGRQKGTRLAVADASWLYFEETIGFRTIIAKVPLSSGETWPMRTPFRNVYLLDISPDKTELLVASLESTYGSGPNGTSPIWRLPTSGAAPHPVGHVHTISATWSPDGRHIAYPAGRDLWEVDTDGNNARLITQAPAAIDAVRWSPDGETLTFDDGSSDWKVQPDGQFLKPWAHPGLLGNILLRGAAWTPDGRYLTVTGHGIVWVVPQNGSFAADDGQPIQLNLGFDSALVGYSNDSQKAYVARSGTPRSEFMIYDRRAHGIVRPAQLASISPRTAAFSPDGQWIAYSADDNSRLWRSKADGSSPLLLTNPPLDGSLPAWSPDGTQIAFMGSLAGEWSHIYSVGRDGGEARPLVPESVWPGTPGARDHWLGGPSWSPDGKQIAFGENGRFFPISPTCAIHIFDLATQRLSTVPDSQGLWTARWSPAGRYLAALTRDDQKLMLYDFQTRKWTQFDDGFIGDNPAWSQDGNDLYYLKPYAEPPAIMCLHLPAGHREQVADLSILDRQRGSFTLWSGVAPGDDPLLIRRDYNDEIYAYDLKLPH
ncbi:MAG: protein kinase [Bryobacteraceae bacterium]|jgi:serine/threonine protein kinase/Tol biopolymer transport system component